jgi:hypothetical protein
MNEDVLVLEIGSMPVSSVGQRNCRKCAKSCEDERRQKEKCQSLLEFDKILKNMCTAPDTRKCAMMLMNHCLLGNLMGLSSHRGAKISEKYPLQTRSSS